MIVLYNRKTAVITAAAILLSLTGCTKSDSGDTRNSDITSAESSLSYDGSVKMNEKPAEFPELLGELGDADVLSNEVYTTFDDAALTVEPEKQPFDGYKCTACFADSYYIFMKNDGYGLLDSNGKELISPEGVTKITAMAKDLLCAKSTDGTTRYYRVSNGGISTVDNVNFDRSRITFEELADTDDSFYDTQHYVISLDGEPVYDSKWIGFETLDASKLDTDEDCAAVYAAWNGVGRYYLVFDRFYNLTVYKAEYAKVSLKIGDDYGECYITDPDDYDDLETLISSFGSEERSEAPERTSGSDYIRIEGGLAFDEEHWVRTLSADGYCFTEIYSQDSGTPEMYFTVMNIRTFTDLVSWVGNAVNSEYGVR